MITWATAHDRILHADNTPGILSTYEMQIRHCMALGAVFVAAGLDNQLLDRHNSAWSASCKTDALATLPLPKGSVY